MSPGLRQDLADEARVVARAAILVVTFFALRQFVPGKELSPFWGSALFLAEAAMSLAVTWFVFVWLGRSLPRFDLRWSFFDGRPVDMDHLTIAWSPQFPLVRYELGFSYAEQNWVARRIGNWLRERYADVEIIFNPNPGVQFVVEGGRDLVRSRPDGLGLLVAIPAEYEELGAGAKVTLQPPPSVTVANADIKVHLEGSDARMWHNRLVRVSRRPVSTSFVPSQGEF